jgi:predicted dehydrogenase
MSGSPAGTAAAIVLSAAAPRLGTPGRRVALDVINVAGDDAASPQAEGAGMSDSTRREFLHHTTAIAAGAAAVAWGAAAGADDAKPAEKKGDDAPVPASEKIVMGIIGPGGQGSGLLSSFSAMKDVHVAWVCDVDERRAEVAAKRVKETAGNEPRREKDMRRMLDDKSVDAVIIATPDHWHAPATILACDAGKHVYVEKPASHNIREGRLMVEAARRNNRVVQLGTQSRGTTHIRKAMELIKSGAIGDVLVAKAWNSQKRGTIGKQQPADPPPNLDFDLWLGPAPVVPYRRNLLHGVWRWWYDFGTGDMGNDGVHDIDIARWGLGVETHPSNVAALGGKYYFDDDMQFPDTQYVVFDYPGAGPGGKAKQLIYEQRIWSPYKQEGHENGNAFYGTKAMLVLGKHDGWKVIERDGNVLQELKGDIENAPHHRDFLDCVRATANGTVKRPRADIETGHLSSSLSHLGNIATRLGRSLRFDPKTEQVIGDEEANRLVGRRYREGGHWAVPKGV